jgi:hypothetical protein
MVRRKRIETHRIFGQKPAHYRSDRGDTFPQYLVKVIGHKRPCKAASFTVGQVTAESIQKVFTVGLS